MLGLWIILAIVGSYVIIALIIGKRQRRRPTIDWSTEASAPDRSVLNREVSQMGAAFAGSIGSPEDNVGLQPSNLKRKKMENAANNGEQMPHDEKVDRRAQATAT